MTKMERVGVISEFIIKIVYGITAFIIGVFVVKNIILMAPLFGVLKLDEPEIVNLISNTKIGPVYESVEAYKQIDGKVIFNAIMAFISSMGWLEVAFLICNVLLLFALFMFIRWNFISNYLKLSGLIILVYFLKYSVFGLFFLIFFNESVKGAATGIFIGNIFYMIFSLIELFLASLFVLKLVLNFNMDIKEIYQ